MPSLGTTAAVEVPFATASPEEIREVLLPEELPRFEEQYREALQVAAETFQLDKLEACLRSWRRIAWMTDSEEFGHFVTFGRKRCKERCSVHSRRRCISAISFGAHYSTYPEHHVYVDVA